MCIRDRMKLAHIYHNMGVIFQAGKDYAKAVDAYKMSLRNNPTDHETRYNLALAQKMLKDQQNQQNQDQNQDQNKDQDVYKRQHDVLRHRIGLTYEAEANNMTSDEIISKILNKVEVP